MHFNNGYEYRDHADPSLWLKFGVVVAFVSIVVGMVLHVLTVRQLNEYARDEYRRGVADGRRDAAAAYKWPDP